MRYSASASAWIRIPLLVYGGLNATLYVGLLPLWDGFDEPFHYGYIHWVGATGSLPVLGKTPLSDEIVKSLDLAPTSYPVWRNLRRGILFDAYFALPEAQRMDLRRQLDALDPKVPADGPQSFNYESHQAPLAYGLLVPLDAFWARAPLTTRILRLRLVAAWVAVLLVWLSTFRLARVMDLPAGIPLAVTFLTFSSQMFYGTVCHIDNDWLALPLLALFFCETVALCRHPSSGSAVRLALWLSAGLLTKAYFLSVVPVAMVLVVLCCLRRTLSWRMAAVSALICLAVAGPWYARNLLLYRNLSGMQETAGGIRFSELAGAAIRLPWPQAVMATVRTSLWTGNNSLFTFSSKTIDLMLFLLTVAALLYAIYAVRNRLPSSERPLLAGLLSFVAGLVYSTVLTFWWTRGVGISPAPWYVQPLLAPGLCLLFIGLSHSRWLGSALALAFVWVWTYVMAATYVAKLIPFYAGFTTSRARLADLAGWWKQLFAGSYGALGTAALLPPWAVIAMAVAVVTMAVTLAVAVSAIILLPTGPFRRTLKV